MIDIFRVYLRFYVFSVGLIQSLKKNEHRVEKNFARRTKTMMNACIQ